MPDLNGKNDLRSTARLAFERSKYSLSAFPENGGLGPDMVVDFNFAERNLYGKVDVQHNPVIPNQDYIVPLVSSNNFQSNISVMNFVSQQFRDLQENWAKACRQGRIPADDPIFYNLIARRGYEDPKLKYSYYMQRMMSSYVKDFLLPRIHRINNFQDFLENLPEFMDRMTDVFPLTFSGYQRSYHSSIFTSGFAIDIADLPTGDDELKQTLMLDNPVFGFYLNMAKQYGFSVNKQNPGFLVSDLAGPATTLYRANYELSTIETVFSKQFEKTLIYDLEEFTYYLREYYNTFVSLYPFNKEPYACEFSNSTKSNITRRNYINNINNTNNNNIIHLYIKIRNIEERKPYKKADILNIYENALRIKEISEERMLEYVDQNFAKLYTHKNGTLSYFKQKRLKKLDKET